jgi:hypothetical protein
MPSFGLRSLTCLLILAAPACVIRLTERNAPEENGAVSGAPVDCSTVQVTPRGGAQGPDAVYKFVGRFDRRDANNVRFDWSGNEIVARFEGSAVSVRIEAAQSDVIFSAVLDGGPPKKIQVMAKKGGVEPPPSYPLFDGLGPGPHEVVFHRDTEAQSGVTTFHGFDIVGGNLLPPLTKNRHIEVIGDSISCGYGIEGQNATCPFDVEVRRSGDCSKIENESCEIVRVPLTERNYLAYGQIVGRRFDADVSTVCWSGKGVDRNYREPTAAGNDARTTLPTYWRERTVGSLINAPAELPPDAKPEDFGVAWDFAQDPDFQVVLINLGTNDLTRDVLLNNEGYKPGDKGVGDNVPDGMSPEEQEKFRIAFTQLITDVRAKRPNAHVFIAVPPMITDQFPIDNARQLLINVIRGIAADFEGRGDKKVYAMELVEQGTRYGLGCDYHPNLVVHEIMANQVEGAIRSKVCWD